MNFKKLLADRAEDKKIIDKLKSNKDKVLYLRLKKYKQEEIAEMIGINVRTVQRIERRIRQEN